MHFNKTVLRCTLLLSVIGGLESVRAQRPVMTGWPQRTSEFPVQAVYTPMPHPGGYPQGVAPSMAYQPMIPHSGYYPNLQVGYYGPGPKGTPSYTGPGDSVTGEPSEPEIPDVSLDEGPELDLDFSEQSAAFASTSYAAAPSFIGDFFGGGSTTATVTNVINMSATATGVLVSTNPNLSFSYFLGQVQGNPDFISVGAGTDTLPPMGVDTFQIAIGTSTALVCPTGTTFNNGMAVNPTGDALVGNTWNLNYTCTQTIDLIIPNVADSGGAVIGRMKIAENSSPIPRDRVFFNYSLFDSVPLTAGGATVNRFSPGFEKTFFNQLLSVETRFPFASSMSANIIADGPAEFGKVQFGNMFVALKAAIARSESTILAGGVSVTIPTAPDLNISLANGTPLVNVANESVHVMPFIGALSTITDRVFAQVFLQIDVDTNGNPVRAQTFAGPFGGMANVGNIRGNTFMYADASVGYWVRAPGEQPDSLISAIAPILELHFNRSLEPAPAVQAGMFQIGGGERDIQILNVVAGGTVRAGDDSLTLGYTFPVGNGSDQLFDGELRAFWNRDF